MRIISHTSETPCDSKNAYSDEELAKAVGRKSIFERGGDLWVYPCPICANWHLTSANNGPDFHVTSPVSFYDRFVHLPGAGSFWERVDRLTIPESVLLLQDLIDGLEKERYRTVPNTPELLLQMISDVRLRWHYSSRLLKRSNFYKAVRLVHGEEAEIKLQVELARVLATEQIHEDCSKIKTYESELEARLDGQRLIKNQSKKDLWVYPCGQCSGWHLTNKVRAKSWHVSKSVRTIDDYADLLGDRNFWRRLVDMPRYEVELIIRHKLRVLAHKATQESGDYQNRIGSLIRRLREELELIYSILRSEMPSRKLFLSLFTQEEFEPVQDMLRDLEFSD